MKKVIVPIIIAAVLIIGATVAVIVMNSHDTADKNPADEAVLDNVEVKSGKYYLNGDKNSDVWMEVNPDYLIVKGTDIDKSLKDAIAANFHGLDPGETPDEDIALMMKNEFESCKTLYCTQKAYTVSYIGAKNLPYIINVSRDNMKNPHNTSAAGFPYNPDTNTIKLGLFGKFTLVE